MALRAASRTATSLLRRTSLLSQMVNRPVSQLAPLSAEQLTIERVRDPNKHLPHDQLVFGHTFSGKKNIYCSNVMKETELKIASWLIFVFFLPLLTDHMLTVEWDAKEGWGKPSIIPYQNLSLDPATCVLHYAFECFEGMKAYKVSGCFVHLRDVNLS